MEVVGNYVKEKLSKLFFIGLYIIGVGLFCSIEVKADELQYEKMVIANVEQSLNIREKASTQGTIVGQMKRGSVGTILTKGKQWTKIKSGNVTGFVSNRYILTGSEMEKFIKENIKTKEAVVNVDILNIREKKTLTAKILGKAKKGDKFEVKGASKEWVRIVYKKKDSFVAREYVTIQYRLEEATAVPKADELTVSGNSITIVGSGNTTGGEEQTTEKTETTVPKKEEIVQETVTDNNTQQMPTNTNLRKTITDYGLQFVGNPYVYGGTSLTEGADCSGFVQSVYGNFGIKLNRVSADQATNGKERPLEDIQVGDLVFYISRGSTRISHVSIYIGDGKVVHALNREKGICVSDLYYNTPYVIRNVID